MRRYAIASLSLLLTSCSTDTTPPAQGHCGDATRQETEACDGQDLGDQSCAELGFDEGALRCNAACQLDTTGCMKTSCGDGTRQGSEACDRNDFGGATCESLGFVTGALACAADCVVDTSRCTPAPSCGNGVQEGDEACDGADLAGRTCARAGFASGTLDCAAGCQLDTSGCVAAICGNDLREGFEPCDGTDLGTSTCLAYGFVGGTLSCNAGCTLNRSACVAAVCGNGVREGFEVCDGGDFDGATCATHGFFGGTLGCAANCAALDLSTCSLGSCGDGVADGLEPCDGNSMSCSSLWLGAGTITCTDTCAVDVSACQYPDLCAAWGMYWDGRCDACELLGGVADAECASWCAANGWCANELDPWAGVWTCENAGYVDPDCGTCGNGLREGYEQCDGAALAGENCLSVGPDSPYVGGTLGCTTSCTFDTGRCVLPVCGDGVAQGGEVCDGADLEGYSCAWFGYPAGTLACAPRCDGFVLSGCGLTCGNGSVDDGEQCDGSSLGGLSCAELRYTGGALACTSSCTLDASACSGGAAPAACGNGTLEGYEECDGDAVVYSCSTFALGPGSVACNADCSWNFSTCASPDLCDVYGLYGDGDCIPCDLVGGVDDPECGDVCGSDGYCADIFFSGVWSCQHAGYTDPDCSCGNGIVEHYEMCDGAALDGETCASQAFIGGSLACAGNCVFDYSGCY